MTMPRAHISPPPQQHTDAQTSRGPGRTAAAALVALLLAACSSTPLPPWNAPGATAPRPNAPAPVPRAQPGRVVPAPLGAQQQAPAPQPGATGVITAPLPPTAPVVGRNEPLATPPYGPAVMARFPDPTVRYSTPGLAPGRRAYTTNAEVEQWLQSVASGTAGGPSRASVLRLGTSQRGEPWWACCSPAPPVTTRPAWMLASARPWC